MRWAVAATAVLAVTACAGAPSAAPSSGRPSGHSAGLPTSAPATPVVPTKDYRPSYGPPADRAVAMSWVGSAGWMLVARRCGSGHRRCAVVFGTGDAGTHWRRLAALPARVGSCRVPGPCVRGIAFADDHDGYLFGPGLWVTRDGGHTWARERGPTVDSLTAGPGRFYRIGYGHGGCPGPCDPRLQTRAVTEQAWSDVPGPRFSSYGSQVLATPDALYVVSYGHIAGGVSSHALIQVSRDGGGSWSTVSDPCGRTRRTEIDTAAAAAAGEVFAVWCQPKIGGTGSIAMSTHAGASFAPRRRLRGLYGEVLAVTADGDLAVAGTGAGPAAGRFAVAVSRDHGRTWRRTAQPPAAAVTDGMPGYLAFAPAGMLTWVGDPYRIWRSRDGGRRFDVRRVP